MTGFAKFFLFLIIAAPLAFIGASYYNGQDPFKTIKSWELFKSGQDNNKTALKSTSDETLIVKELELKDMEIKQLSEKIKKLEELVESQKKEINELKSNGNN